MLSAVTYQEVGMKRWALALLLLLLLLPLAASAQVIRCADGSYSDRCDGQPVTGGNVSSYTAPQRPQINFSRDSSERYRSAGQATRESRPVQTPQSTRQRAEAAGISRNDLVRARARGELLTGMARKDVDHIMGRPADVNTYVNSSGRCDDLWYRDRRSGWHTRITMCNGRLQSYGADNR
jgi:hypothetical protein